MSSRKKELLAEIKQQYPDMPDQLRSLLSKYCDEDALLSVKETMRKDGNKFHFELENNEFIVSSGKKGTPFSIEVLSADGEKYVYAENDNNGTFSIMSSSNDGDNFVLQNNTKIGQTRVVMQEGQDGAFWEAENGNITWHHEDEKFSIDSDGMTHIDEYSTSKFTPQGGKIIDIDEGVSQTWYAGAENDMAFKYIKFDTWALTGVDIHDYSEASSAVKEELKEDVMKNVSVKVDIKDGMLRSVKQQGKDVQYELNYGKKETSYVTRKENADGKRSESIKVTADRAEYLSRYEDNNGDTRNEQVTVCGELPWFDQCSTGSEIVAVIEKTESKELAEVEKMKARRDGDTIVYEFETSCNGHTNTQQVEEKNGEITSIKYFEDGELVEDVCLDEESATNKLKSGPYHRMLEQENRDEKLATANEAINKLKSMGYCHRMPEFEVMKYTRNGDKIKTYAVGNVEAGGSLADMLMEFREVMSMGGKDLTASNDGDNCYYSGSYKKFKELQTPKQLGAISSFMEAQALNRQNTPETTQEDIMRGQDINGEKQAETQNHAQKNLCEIHHTVTDEGTQFYAVLNGKKHGVDVVQKGSDDVKVSAYNQGELLNLANNSLRAESKSENGKTEVSQFFNGKPYGVWVTLSDEGAKNVKIYDIEGKEIPVDNVAYVKNDYTGLKESLHNQAENPEQNVKNPEQNVKNPEIKVKNPNKPVDLKIIQGHWRAGR